MRYFTLTEQELDRRIRVAYDAGYRDGLRELTAEQAEEIRLRVKALMDIAPLPPEAINTAYLARNVVRADFARKR